MTKAPAEKKYEEQRTIRRSASINKQVYYTDVGSCGYARSKGPRSQGRNLRRHAALSVQGRQDGDRGFDLALCLGPCALGGNAAHKTLAQGQAGQSLCAAGVVELVDDGMHENGVAAGDGDDGVGGHTGPVAALEGERLGRHEDHVLRPVESFHLEQPGLVLEEAQAGAEVQGRRLVGLGGDVAAHHHQLAVGDGKVEKQRLVGQGGLPLAQKAYGGEERLAQHLVVERRVHVQRVVAHFVEGVQEERAAALAVGGALDEEEKLVVNVVDERALDLGERQHSAVVHEHDAAVRKRVTVGLRQHPLRGRPHVREHQVGLGAVGQQVQVDVVPCWRDGLEHARLPCAAVVAHAEAVAVDGVAHIEPEPRVK